MHEPNRRRLPKRRKGMTFSATVGGHLVTVSTGEYEDGSLGEVFIDMHKEGAAFRSMMNNFAILLSVSLQNGVPLSKLVDRFSGETFEPNGQVLDHDGIIEATSVIDFIFQALGAQYVPGFQVRPPTKLAMMQAGMIAGGAE